MLCKIYSGVPGSGKTLSMLDEIATTPGRYVVATPRKELHNEFGARLRGAQQGGSTAPVVTTIHSGQMGFREGVVRRIEDALRDCADSVHCVVFITHEALFLLDPEKLAGWHVRIDEVPDGAVVTDAFSATASFRTLGYHYGLEPTGHERWYQVVPRPGIDPVKPGEYRTDAAGPLAAFHKAATNSHRAVFVDLPAWDEARAHRRRVHWWSIWTPTSLRACASVAITGAGFFRSLLYHACRFIHDDRLAFEKIDPSTSAPGARPRVVIHYFTRHPGSTTWWQTNDGSLCLVRICEHLQRIGFSGYWSSNHEAKAYFLHRFGGDAVEPRQAGTNALRHHSACAYIYSAKAQPAELALLDLLGLEKQAVSIAREQEDVIQFVMRGKVRDPHFDGAYDIFLYSEDQAEALRKYLVGEGITDSVEVRPVAEAGIMDVARPAKGGQSAISLTEVSVREREERRKANDRERSQRLRDEKRAARKAEGTYRGLGRPRKGEATPASCSEHCSS